MLIRVDGGALEKKSLANRSHPNNHHGAAAHRSRNSDARRVAAMAALVDKKNPPISRIDKILSWSRNFFLGDGIEDSPNAEPDSKKVKKVDRVDDFSALSPPEASTAQKVKPVMSNWKLPQDSSQRRVVMVLSRPLLRSMQGQADDNEEINEFLYGNNQISLIDLESAMADNETLAVAKLRQNGLLNSGAVLLQDPLNPDDGYVRIEDAQYNIAVNKYVKIAHYFLAIGAKHVTIKRIELLDANQEVAVKAGIESGAPITGLSKSVKAELDLQAKATRRMQNEFQCNMGGIVLQRPRTEEEILSLLEKLKYVEEYPLLAGFFENRPKEGKIKFVVKATSEIKRTLELATSISIPDIAGLQSRVKSAQEESFSFSLQVRVYFPGTEPKDDIEDS